jgi:DNA-binding beta-propeller fold protein YncE
MVTRTITTGAGPVGIAVTPDGRHLVVTNWSTNKVQLIDESTGIVIAEEGSRGEQPVKVVLANDGYTIVVLNFGNDTANGSLSVYTLEDL